jgi:Metallo-beta-lactamase superfamily
VIFTLEALQADGGDCLVLHYGANDQPRIALIDGGPSGIYQRSLRPRLDELRAARSPDDPLPLQLVVVSHIDGDHILGILDLAKQLAQEQEDGAESGYDVLALWHNSFEDIVGGSGGTSAIPAEVSAASAGPAAAALGLSEPARLVVASLGQGRQLRDRVRGLSLDGNPPFGGPVVAPRELDLDDGLGLTIVGPSQDRLARLQRRWESDVVERAAAPAEVAAYVDRSVYNLSSIVILAQVSGKKMLLTGDARGDDILEGLQAAGLLDEPPLHVDLLKLPHHGSDRNVETDFFRKVIADHYVVSGDGTDGNPEIAALRMISEARGDDDFVLHLTNRDGKNDLGRKLQKFEAEERARNPGHELRFRETDALSLKIDLLDPVTD